MQRVCGPFVLQNRAEQRWPNITDGNERRLCCVDGGHQIVSALQLCLAAKHHTRSVFSLFADTIGRAAGVHVEFAQSESGS